MREIFPDDAFQPSLLNPPLLDAALTSYQKSTKRLTTYFSRLANSSPSLIFHEAVHGYGSSINNGKAGKFSDEGLYTAFGITDPNRRPSDITDYIEKHCGKYFRGEQ